MNWKFFTLKEMTRSSTATKLGIDNTPNKLIINNLNDLVTNVLDPLREAYGKPIRVTSGYRCEALNKAVNGVKNSQHMKGQAADIQPLQYKEIDNFIEFVRNWCLHNDFDQCIIETSKTGKWIHISWRNENRRKKLFNMFVNK